MTFYEFIILYIHIIKRDPILLIFFIKYPKKVHFIEKNA